MTNERDFPSEDPAAELGRWRAAGRPTREALGRDRRIWDLMTSSERGAYVDAWGAPRCLGLSNPLQPGWERRRKLCRHPLETAVCSVPHGPRALVTAAHPWDGTDS